MTDQSSASVPPLIGHDRVCMVVQGLLRTAKARGWTDEALYTQTGVPARTIKSYRVEGKEPSLANALALALVLGGDAINGILSLIGYAARPLDEGDEVSPSQIIATILPHVSTLATAAADGRFDHTERPAVRDAADHIIATVMPLSSAGEAV